tara:strand:- start:18036 stop:19196 length:1161 start_codon:yes stop_codon:yes gene_type:complete
MKINFIPYSKPDLGKEEILASSKVISSGWITTGKVCQDFEKAFSSYLSKKNKLHSISVNSATSGLHLALEACGIKKGDEVIVPSLTFASTAEVVRYLDAEVKFVDINYNSMNVTADLIKNKISKKTKAIIVVHYAGLSCEMNEICKLAKEYNLKIIEDAAHCLPTSYNKKNIGNLETDVTVFSFYANKSITTGEGGMVVTKSKNLAKRIRIMRLHGIDRDPYDRFISKKSNWYYEIIAPGFKYNLPDINAAIGLEQLKKLKVFHRKRVVIANHYLKSLKDCPIVLPSNAKNDDLHAWHLFVIRIKKESGKKRDELISFLKKNNIGSSLHYIPLHMQPYWRERYKLKKSNFPNTEKSYEEMISLPIYPLLNKKEQNKIILKIKEFFK